MMMMYILLLVKCMFVFFFFFLFLFPTIHGEIKISIHAATWKMPEQRNQMEAVAQNYGMKMTKHKMAE